MEKLVYFWWAALAITVLGLMALGWLVGGLIQHWNTVRALITVIVVMVIWRPVMAFLAP